MMTHAIAHAVKKAPVVISKVSRPAPLLTADNIEIVYQSKRGQSPL